MINANDSHRRYSSLEAYHLKYGELAPVYDDPKKLPLDGKTNYQCRLMVGVKKYFDYPHINWDPEELAVALDVDEQQLYDAIQAQKEHMAWCDSLTGY